MSIEINNDNLNNEVLNYQGLVVIDFWANWCGPCRKLSPVIEDIEKYFDGKVKFVKVNADKNTEIVKKFSVSGLPCLLVLKNGESIERMAGLIPRNTIISNIEKYL